MSYNKRFGCYEIKALSKHTMIKITHLFHHAPMPDYIIEDKHLVIVTDGRYKHN